MKKLTITEARTYLNTIVSQTFILMNLSNSEIESEGINYLIEEFDYSLVKSRVRKNTLFGSAANPVFYALNTSIMILDKLYLQKQRDYTNYLNEKWKDI